MRINDDGDLPAYAAAVISGRYRVAGGGAALAAAIERARAEVDEAIACGAGIIVLTDRDADADHAPIPSLLLTSAVHQHLVRTKARTKVALVVEAGDAREVHHMALLLGYGAGAVNPYLALETVADSPRRMAALLVGVNAGPLITPWASLATLLWHQRLAGVGVDVPWRRYVLLGLVAAPLTVALAVVPLAL